MSAIHRLPAPSRPYLKPSAAAFGVLAAAVALWLAILFAWPDAIIAVAASAVLVAVFLAIAHRAAGRFTGDVPEAPCTVPYAAALKRGEHPRHVSDVCAGCPDGVCEWRAEAAA